jgi:hypothetical protein
VSSGQLIFIEFSSKSKVSNLDDYWAFFFSFSDQVTRFKIIIEVEVSLATLSLYSKMVYWKFFEHDEDIR